MTADLLALAKECGAVVADASESTAYPRTRATFYIGVCGDELAAFAARIRAEALEEAAKACDERAAAMNAAVPKDRPLDQRQSVGVALCYAFEQAAAAIRALAQPPGEKK